MKPLLLCYILIFSKVFFIHKKKCKDHFWVNSDTLFCFTLLKKNGYWVYKRKSLSNMISTYYKQILGVSFGLYMLYSKMFIDNISNNISRG